MKQKAKEILQDLIRELSSENSLGQVEQLSGASEMDKVLPVELIAPLHHLLLQTRALDFGYHTFYDSLNKDDYELEVSEMPLGSFSVFVEYVFESVFGRLPNQRELTVMQTTIMNEEQKNVWYK